MGSKLNIKNQGIVSGRKRGWDAFCYAFERAWEGEIDMKDFVMSKLNQSLLTFDLQLFAEGGEGGQGSESGNEGEGGSDGQEGTISFKDQSELDSYLDKRLDKALNTARTKWEEEAQAKIKAAEKKGQMTAEEKAQFELDQQRQELEKERLGIQREKDEAATIKKLTEEKLPISLAKALTPLYGGEQDTLDATFEEIAKTFRESLEEAVNARLASSAGAPGSNSGGAGGNEAGSYGKRLGKQNHHQETKSKFFSN